MTGRSVHNVKGAVKKGVRHGFVEGVTNVVAKDELGAAPRSGKVVPGLFTGFLPR